MSRPIYSDAELICQSIEMLTEAVREMAPPREAARLFLVGHALEGVLANPEMGTQTDAFVASASVRSADACMALLYPHPAEVKP